MPYLPDSDHELYILVDDCPTKGKVVWQTLVDVSNVINKLKELNIIFHNDLNESVIDDIANKLLIFVVIKVQAEIFHLSLRFGRYSYACRP